MPEGRSPFSIRFSWPGRRGPRKHSEVASWRILARNRLDRIRDDRQLAQKRGVQREEVFEKIERALDDADATLAQRGLLRGLRNWLTGVDIERVWFRLHEAEQLLFLVLEDDAIRARVPGLMAEVALRLPRTDPRALIFAAQLRAIGGPGQPAAEVTA